MPGKRPHVAAPALVLTTRPSVGFLAPHQVLASAAIESGLMFAMKTALLNTLSGTQPLTAEIDAMMTDACNAI
jgi:hypothetical protein